LSFSPEKSCQRHRHIKLSVELELVSDENDGYEYYTFLIVNGTPSTPFIVAMTAGDIGVRERAIWPIVLQNATNEVRLKVVSIDTETGIGKQVVDTTRYYHRRNVAC
jgi:hypothetical protein